MGGFPPANGFVEGWGMGGVIGLKAEVYSPPLVSWDSTSREIPTTYFLRMWRMMFVRRAFDFIVKNASLLLLRYAIATIHR
jgi:hypothetical protein